MSRRIPIISTLAGIVLLGSTILSPISALAFSSYGAGTIGNPYRIATCAQLSEIDSNLSANYILVANIDCTGFSFLHLANSTPFSGTLDGRNHTIKNLVIDSTGLFYLTSGATIKNINIIGGSTPSWGYGGSFVARATDTIMTNLHSSMTISENAGAYKGGIVGSMSGTSRVAASSFSGNISGAAYTGGIVGAMWDNTTSVTDSFTTGTLHPYGAYNGLIVGGFFAGTISNVYTSGTIDNGVTTNIGGIIGDSQASLSNSFSAANFSGTTSDNGAVTAYNVSGTYSNVYYDKYITNTAGMCVTGTCTGTAVNVGNTTPTYFMNNSTNGPFNAWDFNNIWQTTSGYPTLRNLADFTDAAVPNSGDANGDGTQDAYQGNVASLPNGQYVWSTIEIPFSSGCSVDHATWTDPSYLKADLGFSSLLSTMTGFSLYCPAPGATVPVTIIYDKQYDTSKAVLRHFNSTTNTFSTILGATFGTRTVGGVVKSTVSYNITDGGSYDTDGLSNGVIVDPVIPAVSSIGAPNTGVRLENPLLAPVLTAFGLSVLAFYVRKRRITRSGKK